MLDIVCIKFHVHALHSHSPLFFSFFLLSIERGQQIGRGITKFVMSVEAARCIIFVEWSETVLRINILLLVTVASLQAQLITNEKPMM